MSKYIIILALVFLITGQLTECANQNVCMGDYIKIRAINEDIDIYNPCYNCTCIINIRDGQNNIIINSTSMTYLDAGYFGYQTNSNLFINNDYIGYATCTYQTNRLGSTCVNFKINECLNNAFKINSKFQIGDENNSNEWGIGLPDFGEFFEQMFSPYGTALSYLGLSDVADVFSIFWTYFAEWMKRLSSIFIGVIEISYSLILNMVEFVTNPTEYITQTAFPYLRSLLIMFILSNSILFVIYEMFAIAYTINTDQKSDIFKLLQDYLDFHIKTVDFMVEKIFIRLFNVTMRISEFILKLILELVNAIIPW